ncbi:MAG TPA: LptA/OstA family protein [Beijerinckiaceae bacterium]|nr:LptA/OstA family protein [Beijerinckiaceae bacterium]
MRSALLFLALCMACGAAQAAQTSPLLPGGGADQPVRVNSDKLEYLSKKGEAVYSGHVLAKQGNGSLRASRLTIFFTGNEGSAADAGNPALSPNAGSQVSRMEAQGPVTIIEKGQIGVGDRGVYDRAKDQIELTGHVSLTQGPNVVQGDRLIYDLRSGQAQVVGRVTSLFVPGQGARAGARKRVR